MNTPTSSKPTFKKALILLLPVVFAIVAALAVAFMMHGAQKPAEDPTPPPAESSSEPEDAEVMLPIESEAEEEFSEGLEFSSNGDGTATVVGIGSCTDTVLIIPARSPSGETVIAIGEDAFNGIIAIDEVFLPDTLMSIGENAFRGSGINAVSVGSAVITIGDGAFAECTSLTCISVSPANAMYASVDGVLFDREMSELICYPSGKTARRYTLPNTVTRIAPHAFNQCESLKEVAFEGTEKEWKNVYVCSGNESLHAAILSFARNEK
jgi:hypothetical protein